MGKYLLEKTLTVQKVLSRINGIEYSVSGPVDVEIKGVASIFDGDYGYASYCLYSTSDKIDVINKCNSTILILHSNIQSAMLSDINSNKTYIFSDNPKLMFVQMFSSSKQGIIASSAVIEDGAIIGTDSSIGNLNSIRSSAVIGDRVHTEDGCIIGVAGLSFAEHDGRMIQMPQFGKAVISDDVLIGSNTVIMRGLLDDTIIGESCLIGNQCTIGHEVKIGRNTFIAAGVIVSGGVSIGENCWIGPGVKILQKIKIGDNCKIGIGSVVVKDIANDMFAAGNPARVIGLSKDKGSMV